MEKIFVNNFQVLGEVAYRLHGEMRLIYYQLLPVFFCLSLVVAWFRHPQGGPDFIETLKRAFISTLLLVGFAEITDAILFLTNGLADKIDSMAGLDSVMKMASEKSKGYTMSASSMVLAFNDLLVAALAFLSYVILYVARYVMVAVYHFSWVFLSIVAPIILLFHLFTPKLTLNLFKSMIEIASWKIVWSVLSAMLVALPFGEAYMMDGNYLTVIVLNFVIALCMLGTPLVVHALVGNGLTAMTGALGPTVAATMLAAPTKAISATKIGRSAIDGTKNFAQNTQSRIASRFAPRNANELIKPYGKSSPPPTNKNL
jgi:hypothetical protein